MYGIARVKAIADTSREGAFSSFANPLCLQKLKKIKINMNFLKRVKQMLGNLVIKFCNIYACNFDH